MLRIHIMQLVYNLSDPAMEDELYEIESMRRFAGIRLDRVPDETTILNFRHLLEQLVVRAGRQLLEFEVLAQCLRFVPQVYEISKDGFALILTGPGLDAQSMKVA